MENELSDKIEVLVHCPLTSRQFFYDNSTSESGILLDVKGSTKIRNSHLVLKKTIDD